MLLFSFILYMITFSFVCVLDYPGLSIGVPIRDKNAYNTLVNNPYFLLITGSNAILDMLGLSLGGFPPPSASTEHDN